MREIQAIRDIDFPEKHVDKVYGKKNKTGNQYAPSFLAVCPVVLLCQHRISPPGYIFGVVIFSNHHDQALLCLFAVLRLQPPDFLPGRFQHRHRQRHSVRIISFSCMVFYHDSN
jgi:hypothetical protein